MWVVGFLIGDVKRSNGEWDRAPVGTFFVIQEATDGWWGLDHNPRSLGWVVTARHVVDTGCQNGGTLEAQMRDEQGNVRQWPFNFPWFFSDDSAVDIAINAFQPPNGLYPIMLPTVLDASEPNGQAVELGQQVYFAGLWSSLRKEAQPVLRTASVAGRDLGDVYWESGGSYYTSPKVHLIDTRSKGGFSGSPCFVQWSVPRMDDTKRRWPDLWRTLMEYSDEKPEMFGWNHTFTLWWGMFVAHQDESAIGIVIPTTEIKALLHGPKGQEMKFRREAAMDQEIKDLLPVGQSVVDDGFTEDVFGDALHRATRITTPDESAPEGSGT
jgi:hypothetical protein